MQSNYVIAIAVLLLVGCGASTHASPPPVLPATTSQTETRGAVIPRPTTKILVSPALAVSEDVARLCRLDLDNIERAPKFSLNSSELRAEDSAVLDKIARCLLDGNLGWVSLQLIGHTDARGTTEYNMALGGRRARAIAEAFEGRGVASDRIFELSRGEQDAVGTDEATWAADRRVDVLTFRPLQAEE